MLPQYLAQTLASCRYGIEKESLRSDPSGHLATTPHPIGLGSKLTHPMITTDYAETQLELITPTVNTLKDVKSWLTDLHGYVSTCLDNEIIWPSSMPCLLPDDNKIAIANYGTSNSGRMKMVYRQGLAHRYGRHMQTISGLHFNMSFGDPFWELLSSYRKIRNTRMFRDDSYMGLVRNFVRHVWLVALLYGSSPAFAANFLKDRQDLHPSVTGLTHDHTWSAPFATTLRMSEVGYKNASQQHLIASYNTLKEYLQDLEKATTTSDPRFEKFGVVHNGIYEQLNTNIIQIEAEYYGSIRPKNPVKRCERPVSALRNRGIEYIEIRAIDINPFEAIGIEDCGLYWMPIFMTWCILRDSPALMLPERRECNQNLLKVVHEGRKPDLNLFRHEQKIKLNDWAVEIFAELDEIAQAYSDATGDPGYIKAQNEQRRRLADFNLLPSAAVLNWMETFNNEHIAAQLNLGLKHTAQNKEQGGGARRAELELLARSSLEEQAALERDQSTTFEDYLKCYFSA